ncbi:hypothetical protein [Human papillomavirus type 41]|uniref:ORF Y protein n=1 Tax=Human papillomavirus type 41 TaxID=10589 RepID=Q84213_HPV41|nr:hypothetical protein [Human papillomavirus type 41]CAA39621.1 ORF Y [Human papillomavirus type 41]
MESAKEGKCNLVCTQTGRTRKGRRQSGAGNDGIGSQCQIRNRNADKARITKGQSLCGRGLVIARNHQGTVLG